MKGRIHGLIVERGMEGFTTPETHNKWSLRASSTGELIFDNVKVKFVTKQIWFGAHNLDVRFSTLRNRLELLVLLWIVMTALRYAKEQFNLTNQSQE
jgi:alkylation response protein AidB-like acyl-CoA dehydrogenase